MSEAQLAQLAAVVILGLAFLDGVKSTRELRAIHVETERPGSRITFAFYAIALLITIVAGVIGALTLRTVLGFERLPWSPFVVLALLTAILFIPRFLRLTVKWVREDRA